MKKLTITLLVMYFTLPCASQTINTTYYKTRTMEEEVAKDKARFSQTTTINADGSITTERKDLKKNQVYSRQVLKEEEPVGTWIYLGGVGPIEIDYDFTVDYSEETCVKNLNIKDYFTDDKAIGYVAPKISTGNSFLEFVGKNIVYPGKAMRERITGKVYLTFDITKEGIIENIRVKKGVHLLLDKEAVRIIRKLKFVSPPKINGQPRSLCATTAILFHLN